MSTSRLFKSKIKQNFEQIFDKSAVQRLGRSSGFAQRKPQKVSSYDFVLGFMLMCAKGKSTFAGWAMEICQLTGKTVSRQAIWDRISEYSTCFAQKLLEKGLASLNRTAVTHGNLLASFRRVLLQDSTVHNLSETLSEHFPGNTCGGKKKSQVRIQTILNLTSFQFMYFNLSGFTNNDQSASSTILSFCKKGDLVIRDLGYFALSTFSELMKRNAHFLSRCKYGISFKDLNGQPISLSGLLKKRSIFDAKVLAGESNVPVRLIMIPLDNDIMNQRIRKARQDRDKRLNHSKQYYQWLGYSVFITSVDEKTWTPLQALEVYKLRWQIEMVFKSWKSSAGLPQILHDRVTDPQSVKTILTLFLLFMCLIIDRIINPARKHIEKKSTRLLSLIKAIKHILTNFEEVLYQTKSETRRQLAYYCCYDKRKDRTTMAELINKLA